MVCQLKKKFDHSTFELAVVNATNYTFMVKQVIMVCLEDFEPNVPLLK